MQTIVRNTSNAPRCYESSKFKPDTREFLLFLENNTSCTPQIGYFTSTNGFVNLKGESVHPPKYWAYVGVSFGVDKSF